MYQYDEFVFEPVKLSEVFDFVTEEADDTVCSIYARASNLVQTYRESK